MFFVVRWNNSFNFPLGLIKYTVIVITGFVISCCQAGESFLYIFFFTIMWTYSHLQYVDTSNPPYWTANNPTHMESGNIR